MKPRRRLTSLLLLVSLLAGCATALPPPRAPVPEDARRALELLTRRWEAFTDLRTLADIELHRRTESQRLFGVLLVKAPASVRFEALSPFGQPVLVATVHDGEIRSYNLATNEASVAPATADTAAHVLGLPLEPEDLVAVLAGLAVPPHDLRVAQILSPDDHGPSLEITGSVHTQRIWMDFGTGIVHQVEITGGRYAVTVRFERDGEGALKALELNAANGYLTGTVRYRDPLVGAGIDPGVFTLPIPKGAKIRALR